LIFLLPAGFWRKEDGAAHPAVRDDQMKWIKIETGTKIEKKKTASEEALEKVAGFLLRPPPKTCTSI
jgi:hypothetical protein